MNVPIANQLLDRKLGGVRMALERVQKVLVGVRRVQKEEKRSRRVEKEISLQKEVKRKELLDHLSTRSSLKLLVEIKARVVYQKHKNQLRRTRKLRNPSRRHLLGVLVILLRWFRKWRLYYGL